MPRVISRKLFLFLFLLALALVVVRPVSAQADLSRLVVVGDSLSAGYQNGSLLNTQQVHGYANLVAKQARTPLTLPLIDYPGVPQVLELKSVNPLVIGPASDPIGPMPRINYMEQATDLAVPGATVSDALNKMPCVSNSADYAMTNLVLGIPGCYLQQPIVLTQVQWAQALQPTTIILWIGNNDALNGAINGNGVVTPMADFENSYTNVVNGLAATNAKLVIANIPDVTTIPYLFSVPQLAAMFGAPESYVMYALNLGPGDYVTLDYLSTAAAILQTGTGTLPNNAVFTAAEAANVQAAVVQYNAFIASEAARVGAALVDINGLFKQVAERGYVVGGRRITSAYLGGVFSLDGIHPTNTGYAVVANEFIKTINRTFGNNIPSIPVVQVAKSDPLLLLGVGHPANALKPGALDATKKVMQH